MLRFDDPAEAGGRIDELDTRILAELSVNGRVGAGEIAVRLGISRATAAKRLTALLHGAHVRVVGMVHPETLGVNALAHVSISTNAPVRDVAQRLAERPEVPFVSLASGEYPLVAEVRAHDDAELLGFLDAVRTIRGVESTESLLYTNLVQDLLAPAKASADWLDDLDRRLLTLLQFDGRLPYTALAVQAGVSVGTARMRTLRMVKAGVVRIAAITASGGDGRKVDIGLGLRMRGKVGDSAAQLAALPEIRFLAATLGRYDFVATMQVGSLLDSVAVLEQIRALPSVARLHNWVHLERIKENYRYPVAEL